MYYNNEMGRTFKPFPSIPTLLTTHLNCNNKVSKGDFIFECAANEGRFKPSNFVPSPSSNIRLLWYR